MKKSTNIIHLMVKFKEKKKNQGWYEISGMYYLENGSTISSDKKETRDKGGRKWWVRYCTYLKTLSSRCFWNILVEMPNK